MLEDHLRDRTRIWAGTRGLTLQHLGYGSLGAYDKHVRDRINALMSLQDHTCVPDPTAAYLVRRALTYGSAHKGMPAWAGIVDRIRILLTDPDHPAWREPQRAADTLAATPAATPPLAQLTEVLLTSPSELPVETLEWLTDYLLYCAGPPYSLVWSDSPRS